MAPLLRCQTFWRLVSTACPKLTHLEVLLLCPGAISSPLFQHLHQVSACKFKDLKSERQLAVIEVFIEKMFPLVTDVPAKMCKCVTAEAEGAAREGLCVCSCVQEVMGHQTYCHGILPNWLAMPIRKYFPYLLPLWFARPWCHWWKRGSVHGGIGAAHLWMAMWRRFCFSLVFKGCQWKAWKVEGET